MEGTRNKLKAWTVRPQPDGSLQMRPAARSAPGGAVLRWAGALACVALGAIAASGRQGGGASPLVFSAIVFLVGAALAVRGLWGVFVWEDWHVGPDLLEVRRGLFAYRTVARYRGGALKLVHSTSVRYSRRLLNAQLHDSGAPLPTDFRSGWLRLYVVEGRRTRCLRSVDDPREEPLRALGELLAEHTGWPLVLVRSGCDSRVR